jgi:hypothetical protein
MSWLKKITGGDKSKKAPPREFDRMASQGETVSVGVDDLGRGPEYQLLDVSLGGFAVKGYEGRLHGNMYFEFKFNGKIDEEAAEIMGFANVVRVKDGMLAAKFPPQPKLKAFFINYFESR